MAASLKIALITPFIEAVKETFATMVSMELRRREVFIKRGFEMYGDVSAIIGLTGITTGTCCLSVPAELAQDSVRAMLMTPDDDILSAADIRDGMGELVNMIAGSAKSKLSQTQYKFNITLPTIISGGKHEVFHRNSTYCVVVIFENIRQQTLALDVCVAAN